ncbi:MAG: AfsR/SARP family transcriptional regulator [Actinocatenispora sp.]
MQIQVLGPLMLQHEGRSVTPTAPKPRSILSLLLLNAGQTVAVSALSQELWGDTPPVSAQTTIQTYIVHLRRLFSQTLGIPSAEVARTILVTSPGGYLFRTDSDEFDLRTYEEVTAAGRNALAVGEDGVAADLLMTARNLWRGPALADVRHGRLIEPQTKRLEESRLTTTEQSIEARLRLGRHQEVLSELTGLLAEHRLHENLYAQLMVALHRSGRREEALRVFQDLRGAMAEELGLEPSKRLHRLQQAVLSDDPVLEVAPRADGLAQLLDQLTLRLPSDATVA